ncbi:phosphopantetheine-binding protein [Amycolatopsis sp. NPDC004747]
MGTPNTADVGAHAGRIWDEVLNPPPGQDSATFFELLGQSISAVRIVARVSDELGLHLNLGSLFDDPDRATFVRSVVELAETADQVRRTA